MCTNERFYVQSGVPHLKLDGSLLSFKDRLEGHQIYVNLKKGLLQ